MNMGIISLRSLRCVPSYSLFTLVIVVVVATFFNSVYSQLSPAQQRAMITLSGFLEGQNSSLSWDVNANPCSWQGVKCKRAVDTNSSVTELSLSNIGLSEPYVLYPACEIDTLETLDVSKNQLPSVPNGFLKSCGGIQGLKLVNFSWNRIAGSLPSFSSGFAKLESLDLSNNLLNGGIEMQLNGLGALRSLNLSFNYFSGPIPINLGKSRALEQLQLSVNNFHGSMPEQLADYKNLTVLDISRNLIAGNIPRRIGELQKLEVLVVSANKLSGEVPDFISNITTLQRFAANQNTFTGAIPFGISRFLKNLDLSFNNLSGSIHESLLSQPNLQIVDLSSNRLVGSIPSNVSSSLLRLRLGNNSLGGSLLPINFGELKNLEYLELENNNLKGRVPSDLGSCQKLTLLSLAQNALFGELPLALGNLKQLVELKLQQNRFYGEIPHTITQLSRLLTLNLSWNSLSGSIPSSISGLKNLAFLHLQGNHFIGLIPKNIGNMNSLIELQLGNNHLSGDIPSMPKNLQYALNLSNNLFKGPIPTSFSSLTSLEILDLSNNRFSGEIPGYLAKLQSLTLLLLDNNNLSGVVPTFNPHLKVDTSGNDGLIADSKSKKRSATVKIAVAIAAPVGGLVALIVVFFSRKLLCTVKKVEEEPEDEDIPQTQAIETRLLTTNSFHKSNIDFMKAKEAVANPLNFVLKTKFSSYYKVMMSSGQSYFVKRLNRSDIVLQLGCHENFRRELDALTKINSSNIMTPVAYMLASDGAYLFYKTAFKSTLFGVLHGSSGIPLDWASRCSIAVGLAQGLAYLHGCSSGPILLFDLSSSSVILKSLTEPQIGDIELCKLIDPSRNSSSLSAVAGSVGYIPPEYAYTMRVTTEGNVYSFGVILLELVTGKEAVSQGIELAKWALDNSTQPQKWEQMLDLSISRTSQTVGSQMLAVLKIAFACIDSSSLARPKMKSVLRMLLNAK